MPRPAWRCSAGAVSGARAGRKAGAGDGSADHALARVTGKLLALPGLLQGGGDLGIGGQRDVDRLEEALLKRLDQLRRDRGGAAHLAALSNRLADQRERLRGPTVEPDDVALAAAGRLQAGHVDLQYRRVAHLGEHRNALSL